MKELHSLAAAILFCASSALASVTFASSREHDARQGVRERFIGAWRLAWLEAPDADGKVHPTDGTGQLVFTRDGDLAVQVMYRNAQTGSSATPAHYAQGSYQASCGKYEVDERANTFTIHVEGALVRTLIGKDLRRAYEFSGNQLIVKPSDPNEHWRAVSEPD